MEIATLNVTIVCKSVITLQHNVHALHKYVYRKLFIHEPRRKAQIIAWRLVNYFIFLPYLLSNMPTKFGEY